MSKPDRGSYVGVKQGPDGSLDFSRALRMTGGGMEISDPIVNRLRGPLVTDTLREERYSAYQEGLQEMHDAGTLRSWLAGFLNEIRPAKDQPPISEDDLQSLEFVTDSAEIASLREHFGIDLKRPCLRLNLGAFREVYQKLAGSRSANGCVLSGGGVEENALTKGIAVIITPSIGPEEVHELLHTIDPHLNKRYPRDAVLEEFAAYYWETFVPRSYTSRTRQKSAGGEWSEPVLSTKKVYETIPRICNLLKLDLYDPYAEGFDSKGDYDRWVDEIGAVLQGLEVYMSKPDIQKAILNANAFSDLRHLLDVVTRETGGKSRSN